MTVVNIHGLRTQNQRAVTPWSSWFLGRPDPASLKFWLTGIAFLALYLVFNQLTEWHEFGGLGITLWSPDNGLSLLILTEGAIFAPFVLLGAVLTDVLVLGVKHSLYVTFATELVLTVLSTVASYLHAARRLLQSGVASAPVMDVLSKAEAEARRTREVLERIRDFVSNGKLDLRCLICQL